jgi:hypothetical protein
MIKNKDLYYVKDVPKNKYVNEYQMIKNERSCITRGKHKN